MAEINPHILEYIELVESGAVRTNREQKALVQMIRRSFETEDVYTDGEKLEKYLGLEKYFPFKSLFPWQKFILGLWDCTYWQKTGEPRWDEVLCMVGRGAGKDGFIGFDGACMIGPYNPIRKYDVDICANNEDQALRPQRDLTEVLEDPAFEKKLSRHYYHTKEIIQGRKWLGTMKGHTNNPKGRDGLRSGKIILNEVHQYENYDNIEVFTTGLGKVPEPRIGYFTSNGNISDGPLDDYLDRGRRILFDGEPDEGFLPFICCLEKREQVTDPRNWEMANPSLPYLPTLRRETEKEFKKWQQNPTGSTSFLTKRMGLRVGVKELAVTDYENITATKKPLPDLTGWNCTVGLDYAELNDWAAINLHFRRGAERYDINHAWVCLRSRDLERIKAPWQAWAEKGHVTPVDDTSISPMLLADYIREAGKQYNIKAIAMDNFRWTLVSEAMKGIGFDAADKKRVKLVRPSDIMQVEPILQECFSRQLFSWGDNPCLRWAVNNTKRWPTKRKNGGVDTGSYIFAKIEAKSRKTDPFMALVASMVVEPILGDGNPAALPPMGAINL